MGRNITYLGCNGWIGLDAGDGVGWDEVASIEADEDRLVVVVTPREGEEIAVPPRYGGLGVHDLAAAIEEARRRGCVSA